MIKAACIPEVLEYRSPRRISPMLRQASNHDASVNESRGVKGKESRPLANAPLGSMSYATWESYACVPLSVSCGYAEIEFAGLLDIGIATVLRFVNGRSKLDLDALDGR